MERAKPSLDASLGTSSFDACLFFPCDYCGESIIEGEPTFSVPTPKGEAGTLCCPECQLSYSRYLLDPYHEQREPLIRQRHRGHHYQYAPPPFRVYRFNPKECDPRAQWAHSRKK